MNFTWRQAAPKTAGSLLASSDQRIVNRSSAVGLTILLLLSVAVRTVWLLRRTPVVEAEGAYYARLAENLASGGGWVGIHTHGLQLFYPPLFPLLIAGVYSMIHNSELAGRLISLFFGSLLVCPIFLMARDMYGKRVAYLAALLTALHPVLVGVSAAVYSEATYLLILYTGFYCGLRSAREQSCRKAAMGGALLGLAYLVRSEALLTAGYLVVLILVFGNRHKFRAIQVAACMVGVLAAVGAPYVWFLKVQTGQLRIEAKSADNYSYGKMLLSGMTPAQAFLSIDDDLKPIGVTMKSNLETLQTTKFSLSDILRFAKAAARNNGADLVRGLFVQRAVGGAALLGLVILGLFGSPWSPRRTVSEAILLGFLACLSLPFLTLLIFNSRYVVPFIPVVILWASCGVEQFGTWTESIFSTLVPSLRAVSARALGTAGAAGALLVIAWLSIGSFTDLSGGDAALKAAGALLKERFPGVKLVVMDDDPLVAYYAGAALIPFPYAAERTALRYLSANNVNVVVLREGLESGIPYHRDWAIKGLPDSRASLITSLPSKRYGRILLYRWE
jgi:4-amino-4-deoxy-L-arabinose transferase-like glycosyltransferase